jgi:hypothetical protein
MLAPPFDAGFAALCRRCINLGFGPRVAQPVSQTRMSAAASAKWASTPTAGSVEISNGCGQELQVTAMQELPEMHAEGYKGIIENCPLVALGSPADHGDCSGICGCRMSA